MIKRTVPVAIAVAVGLLTFIGLLFNLPQLSNLLLSWAGFLVAVALLLGVLNLFAVHLSRLFRGNGYSGVLVLGMLAVFALAITDDVLNLTENGVETIFQWVQAPLEAGVASLLAFVLLFAGFELLRRQRSIGALLFLLTAVLVLLSYAFTASRLLPDAVAAIFLQIRRAIDAVFVTAGMRGILIGVALGTITLSIRLLVGAERPYNK
jgi:hypothetical protein